MFEMFDERIKYNPDDPIDFDSMYIVVEQLGIRGYQMKYANECKKIWKKLVPKSGQAPSLQGELLRQAEKLRNEACGNGNINWDGNFEWFCKFINETLISSKLFS